MFKSISTPQKCLLLAITRGRDKLRISAGRMGTDPGKSSLFTPGATTAQGNKTQTAGFRPCSAVWGRWSSSKQWWDLSLNIRRVQSPQTLSLSSHSLKKSHLKVIYSYLCQGVLTSNEVPRSFVSFLRKSYFSQISYQEFKVVAESLSVHSWGIPSWRLHELQVTSHRQDCALGCPHWRFRHREKEEESLYPVSRYRMWDLSHPSVPRQTPTGDQGTKDKHS